MKSTCDFFFGVVKITVSILGTTCSVLTIISLEQRVGGPWRISKNVNMSGSFSCRGHINFLGML